MSKLTEKQEKFCKAYIETGNSAEAYRSAYNTANMKLESVHREAKRLMDNPKVATRVAKLQKMHQKRHEVTVDSLTKELEEARDLAKETKSPAAMVSATMGKGKLHGLVIDRSKIAGDPDEPLKVDVTDRDRAKALAALVAKLRSPF